MTNSKKTDLLYLIDGSGYIFRAFYALPPLTRKSDGMPVGAVSGFCKMLYKFLEDAKSKNSHEKPTHIAVIFDTARKNFRNNIYPEYKANRSETPEDLIPQFSFIREAVKAFNLPSIEMENYEADDLIATYKKEALKKNTRVKIISSDKDLMQLIDDQTTLFDSMKNKDIGIEEVKEKFGVTPDKVIEVQALAGDSSDNIPGVPSIGVKTAAELINEFGSVENLLKNVDKIYEQLSRQYPTQVVEAFAHAGFLDSGDLGTAMGFIQNVKPEAIEQLKTMDSADLNLVFQNNNSKILESVGSKQPSLLY